MRKDIQERVNKNNGIWARSSKEGQENYVIFASDYHKEAIIDCLDFNGINFKDMKGSYVMESNGQKIVEDCYIINAKHFFDDAIQYLIKGQESVLWLSGASHDDTRKARLVFNNATDSDGNKIYDIANAQDIGRMKQVSKEEADKSDYWTYDPYTNTYFIAE